MTDKWSKKLILGAEPDASQVYDDEHRRWEQRRDRGPGGLNYFLKDTKRRR